MIGSLLRRQRRSSGRLILRSLAVAWVLLLVVVPLGGIVVEAFAGGFGAFVSAVREPEAWSAIRLTLACAAGVVLVDAVVGTMVAWTLVRYRFPGKTLLTILVDLPFAIPTVVAGLMIVLLYGPQTILGLFFAAHGVRILFAKPGIVLALLFVTAPFVIRAVQPVLMELDPDIERAAFTLGAGPWLTFRRVTLPALLPALRNGCGLAFARALGEFGSVVLVAGNIPFRSQTAAVYVYGRIESDQPRAATAVSVFILALSLAIIALINLNPGKSEERA